MPLEDLKLNKQLTKAMQEVGFEEPTEMQLKCIKRIIGGQDVLGIGPEGCGKTTTIVLSVIMQLKYAFEDVPRALVLVPSREKVEEVVAEFNRLAAHTDLRVQGIHSAGNINTQKDELYLGVDVIVGTPDRVYALTIKYGANLNRLKMFILDDAEHIVKQGFQVPVRELAEGLPKCQHLVFSTVYHKRMENVVEPYFNYPTKIEVFPKIEEKVYNVIPQRVFHLANFQSKVNYIYPFLEDSGIQKAIIFVNTRFTAGTIYNHLQKYYEGKVGMYKALFHNQLNIDYLEDFENDEDINYLIVANEGGEFKTIGSVPHILHVDLPEDENIVLDRINLVEGMENEFYQASSLFSTDLELATISKIESKIGYKIDLEPVVIDAVTKKRKKAATVTEEEETKGSAFHEKSAKNSKDYNYNTKDRKLMSGKISLKRKNR